MFNANQSALTAGAANNNIRRDSLLFKFLKNLKNIVCPKISVSLIIKNAYSAL
jgi:hypothetical protein